MQHTNAVAPSQHPDTTNTIAVYDHGSITDRRRPVSSTCHKPKHAIARRSAITTFSRPSAARLRRRLITTRGREDWELFGLTLTVPGPVITAAQYRRLWDVFRHKLTRLAYGGVAGIWRVEMQTRGQPHVHCVCWGEVGASGIRQLWLETLGVLGPAEGPTKQFYFGGKSKQPIGEVTILCEDLEHTLLDGRKFGDDGEHADYFPGWVSVSHRKMWPGADEHAVKIDMLSPMDGTGWWRYIAAHTSKAKQAQLGWKGRQWGVFNGGFLDRAEPVLIKLSDKAMDKAQRYLKRLTRCRHTSRFGRQAFFTNPQTVIRLCEWAKKEACA